MLALLLKTKICWQWITSESKIYDGLNEKKKLQIRKSKNRKYKSNYNKYKINWKLYLKDRFY